MMNYESSWVMLFIQIDNSIHQNDQKGIRGLYIALSWRIPVICPVDRHKCSHPLGLIGSFGPGGCSTFAAKERPKTHS